MTWTGFQGDMTESAWILGGLEGTHNLRWRVGLADGVCIGC